MLRSDSIGSGRFRRCDHRCTLCIYGTVKFLFRQMPALICEGFSSVHHCKWNPRIHTKQTKLLLKRSWRFGIAELLENFSFLLTWKNIYRESNLTEISKSVTTWLQWLAIDQDWDPLTSLDFYREIVQEDLVRLTWKLRSREFSKVEFCI